MNTQQLSTAATLPAFVFDHEEQAHTLRPVPGPNGHLWWVAKDVCDALGISNSSRALSRVEADEKGMTKLYTPGGLQAFATVNQSGLFALAFQSRMKNARAFRQWVTGTVLPAIYTDGAYIRGEEQALAAATPEELRARLQELEVVAAQAIQAKERRGMCGIEEREASRSGYKLVNSGRKPRRKGPPKGRKGRGAA